MPPEDPKIPSFPSRISLSRLLMEVQMEVQALQVLERLILEDDESVETWYLGGWCLYLLAEKEKGASSNLESGQSSEEKRHESMVASREWLKQGLKLYQKIEYEDDRLRDHALELVQELNKELGEDMDDDSDVEPVFPGGDEEDDWDGEIEVHSNDEDDEDHEMKDS